MGIIVTVFWRTSLVRQRANRSETNLHQVTAYLSTLILVFNLNPIKKKPNRYLDVYERVHFLGEEVDRRESEHHEEDDARNRRKALRLLHATPTSYNASQHVVPGAYWTSCYQGSTFTQIATACL